MIVACRGPVGVLLLSEMLVNQRKKTFEKRILCDKEIGGMQRRWKMIVVACQKVIVGVSVLFWKRLGTCVDSRLVGTRKGCRVEDVAHESFKTLRVCVVDGITCRQAVSGVSIGVSVSADSQLGRKQKCCLVEACRWLMINRQKQVLLSRQQQYYL